MKRKSKVSKKIITLAAAAIVVSNTMSVSGI